MYKNKKSSNNQYSNKSKTGNGIKKNINYNSTDVKSDIVDYLYNCLDIGKYKYRLLKTFNDLKELKEIEHHVSPNFSGKNSFIIFKKFKKGYYSILVDRKTLKYNKSSLDLKNVRFIPLNIKARAGIYDGTIIDGKLIKIENGKSVFMITDVFLLEGKNLTEDKIENKLINIKIYLDQNVRINKNLSKITFDINKLYNYDQIKEMVIEHKNHPSYNMYGIIFYPKKSGVTILFNDLDYVNKPINCNDASVYVQLKKGDYPDVYETFILNDDNKLARAGIAYIPTLKLSQYCDQVFSSIKDNSPVIFKCIFNSDYQKWLPIEKIDGITKPDTLKRVQKILSS